VAQIFGRIKIEAKTSDERQRQYEPYYSAGQTKKLVS